MSKLTFAFILSFFTSTSFAFICCFDGSESLDSLRDNNNIHISILPGTDESGVQQFADQIVSAMRSGLKVNSYAESLRILYVPRTGISDRCFINVNEDENNLPKIYRYNDIVVSPCGGLDLLNFISSN